MSGLTQLSGPARECVEVFAEQSRMALDPVREVVDRLSEMGVDITFAVLVRGLNRHARKTPGEPGELCWALACYLKTKEGTPVAEIFDLAVAEGEHPMVLMEAMLGCARDTNQDDDSAIQHEIVVGRPSHGRTQSSV